MENGFQEWKQHILKELDRLAREQANVSKHLYEHLEAEAAFRAEMRAEIKSQHRQLLFLASGLSIAFSGLIAFLVEHLFA